MFICASSAIVQAALEYLSKNKIKYSLTFEGYSRNENCRMKITFDKEVDSLFFKLKYGDIIG